MSGALPPDEAIRGPARPSIAVRPRPVAQADPLRPLSLRAANCSCCPICVIRRPPRVRLRWVESRHSFGRFEWLLNDVAHSRTMELRAGSEYPRLSSTRSWRSSLLARGSTAAETLRSPDALIGKWNLPPTTKHGAAGDHRDNPDQRDSYAAP